MSTENDNNISQNSFYCIFHQIDAALVIFFKNKTGNLFKNFTTDPNIWKSSIFITD